MSIERTITLKVLTAEGLAFQDEAVSVVARGERGYVGFLRNHAPLVTTLSPGRLSWRRPDGARRSAALGSGLLEIVCNRLTILTDAAAEPAEVGRESRP
jgi:F-type H+-transporting ATPase subunit epsilon